MRTADTYRAARRNSVRRKFVWPGISPGVYPRAAHNAEKLKRSMPVIPVLPELLVALMRRGVAAGTLLGMPRMLPTVVVTE